MSGNSKKNAADSVKNLDGNRGSLEKATSNAKRKPSLARECYRTLRNLAIVGGLTWGAYAIGNFKAGEAKKEAAAAQTDLIETNVRLDIAIGQVKEAFATSNKKALRTFYAQKTLTVLERNPKAHPQDVVRSVFADIRKGAQVPSYQMDGAEREITLITNQIAKLTPNNARGVFVAVIKNYTSDSAFLDENSSTEEVNQAILNFYGKPVGTSAVEKSQKKIPAAGRQR